MTQHIYHLGRMREKMDWPLKYFTFRELMCKATEIVQLSPKRSDYPGFGARIDALREAWGKPLTVNSCCRSAAHNAKIGGHPRSLHVYDYPEHPTGGTCAIDIRETSEAFRKLALDLGFSVGRANTFTHIDDRTKVLALPQVEYKYL